MIASIFWYLVSATAIVLIIYGYAQSRSRLVKVMAMILPVFIALAVSQGELESVLVWALVALPIILVVSMGVELWKAFLVPYAFLLWFPLPVPLYSAISRALPNLFIGDLAFLWLALMFLANRAGGAAQVRKAALPGIKWAWLFCIGGIAAFSSGFFMRPVPGFDTMDALSFLRTGCFLSLVVLVMSNRLVGSPKEGNRIALALMAGALVMEFFILRGERPIDYQLPSFLGDRTAGEFALPFGLTLTVGGNTASIYYAIMTLFALSLALNANSIKLRVFGIGMFLAPFPLIATMATRTVWLTIVPCLFVVVLLSIKIGNSNLLRTVSLLAPLALLALMVFISTQWSEDIITRKQSLLSWQDLQGDSSVVYRIDQYVELGEIIVRNPQGVGYQGTYYPSNKSPHSLLLKLALSTGIAGMIGYLAFLVSLLVHFYRRTSSAAREARWLSIGSIASILLILLISPGGDVLSRPPLHTSFFLLLGVSLGVLGGKPGSVTGVGEREQQGAPTRGSAAGVDETTALSGN